MRRMMDREGCRAFSNTFEDLCGLEQLPGLATQHLMALGYGLWVTASYLLWGSRISGWTTIVVGMMLLSGVQLLSLGVLGEYVARVFEEVKGRPLYIVARELGQGIGSGRTGERSGTP